MEWVEKNTLPMLNEKYFRLRVTNLLYTSHALFSRLFLQTCSFILSLYSIGRRCSYPHLWNKCLSSLLSYASAVITVSGVRTTWLSWTKHREYETVVAVVFFYFLTSTTGVAIAAVSLLIYCSSKFVCDEWCRFPFYYLLKLCFIMWLVLPATKGSSLLYRKVVHPQLVNREKVGIHWSSFSLLFLQCQYLWHTFQKLAAYIETIFPAPVSGTCVMHIWPQIRLVPDSGAG